MVVTQGEVWWGTLPEPRGSMPGFRRPVLVVQSDALNASRITTALCVSLTSNMRFATAIGNVVLPAPATGLPKDSVANVSQVFPVDREFLDERTGALPEPLLDAVLSGISIVLSR